MTWSQKITLHHVIMMGETFSRIFTQVNTVVGHMYIIIYHQDRGGSYWNDSRGYPDANPHSNKGIKPTAVALLFPRLYQLP